MTAEAHARVERRYQMTRLRAGDYLLPSNDGRSLWRISRYYEDGSLEHFDGTKVVGFFWRAARHPDPIDRIPPHVIGGDASGDDVFEFLSWENWRRPDRRGGDPVNLPLWTVPAAWCALCLLPDALAAARRLIRRR